MRTLTPFIFGSVTIRVVSRSNDPWFVLADMCKVLEIGNPSQAASRLDEDEKDTLTIGEGGKINGLGMFGAMPTIINESGLYSLILTSRKPEAKRFKKWVTAEVIPSIRKHGGYIAGQESMEPIEILARAILVADNVIAKKDARLAVAEPKARAFDWLSGREGSVCLSEAAKALKVTPKALEKFLQQKAWLYRGTIRSRLVGYQAKVESGMIEHRLVAIRKPDGKDMVVMQPLITAKGMMRLTKLLAARMPALKAGRT